MSSKNIGIIGYPRLILLLTVNLIPLLGVILWQWDIFKVICLFWLENAVIGIFNWFKILVCRGSKNKQSQTIAWHANLGMALFFLVHYGFFTSGHGMILLNIFNIEFTGAPWEVWTWVSQWLQSIDGYLWLALLAMVAYWLFDFIQFWLKERLTKVANQQMMEPYSRIVIAHLVLLFGAFFVVRFGFELAVVILLVLVKTFINYQDLYKKQADLRG